MPANLLAGYTDNDLAIIRLAFSTLYVLGLPASMYFYFFDFFCFLLLSFALFFTFLPFISYSTRKSRGQPVGPIYIK